MLFLTLQAVGDNRLKVTWRGPRKDFPYPLSVDAGAITTGATKVRDRLALLSDWSGMNDPMLRHAELAELAKLGQKLRKRLFADPINPHLATALETWVEEESQLDKDLSIDANPSLKVPWGLLYDGEPPSMADAPAAGLASLEDVAAREIALFQGFWSLKYHLSTQTGSSLSGPRLRRPRNTFGLLSLVNEQEHQLAKPGLGMDYPDYCELLKKPEGMAHDLDRCRAMIDERKQRDILFHFYGHHKDAKLDLGVGEPIDYDTFFELMESLSDHDKWKGSPPCGLVFLNGCETAVGNEDVALREASKRPELCGVIATEAMVRRDYAARFGYRLLGALVREGKTVGAAMYALHHDKTMWPQSLLYGCYAEADFCVEPESPPS